MTANKELFKNAFLKADAIETEKYQNKDAFHHEFSVAFEKKMSRLIAKENRISFNTRRKLYKALLAAIIAVLMLITGLMSVSASREKIVEFIEKVFSNNTQITLSENSAPTPETIETAYTLGYVPEGFELKRYEVDEASVLEVWKNNEEEEIVFQQLILNMDFSFDNEHKYEKSILNGYEIYHYYNDYECNVSWSNEEYWFTINAPLTYKNEIYSMLEKISEKN